MPQAKYKIIISGGGTGGHVFPAIAIANGLKKRLGNIDILFVGAKGKMEMTKVPEAGFPIKGLWISGIQRKIFSYKNLIFPFKLLTSLLKAGRIIRRFKPQLIVGVGGFASGPTLGMAGRKGIPTLIQEQNSYPGITNRLLAKTVSCVCVAYDGLERFFIPEKIVKTGNPIREDIVNIEGKRDKAISFFGLNPAKKTMLIVGGSQGALSINESIKKDLYLFNELNIQLIWQTGKLFYDQAKTIVKEGKHENVKVYEFIKEMDLAYAGADIIISRAGAIAISELCAVGKPVIFIPYPYAAEDHQTKNAKALSEVGAAIHLKDNESKAKLGLMAKVLLSDEKLQKDLSDKIKKHSSINATDLIVDEIIKLMN